MFSCNAPILSEILPPSIGHGVLVQKSSDLVSSEKTSGSGERQGDRSWGPTTSAIDSQPILSLFAPPSTPTSSST